MPSTRRTARSRSSEGSDCGRQTTGVLLFGLYMTIGPRQTVRRAQPTPPEESDPCALRPARATLSCGPHRPRRPRLRRRRRPSAPPRPHEAADTWTEVGSDRADPLTESQGLASVEVPANSANRYTGIGTIPISACAAAAGTTSATPTPPTTATTSSRTSADSGTAKMFRVQAPDGTWSEYVHTLGSGRGAEQLLGRHRARRPVDALRRVGHHDPPARPPDPRRQPGHLALGEPPAGLHASASTTPYATSRAATSPARPRCCAPPTTRRARSSA